jgi:hypothetical protein
MQDKVGSESLSGLTEGFGIWLHDEEAWNPVSRLIQRVVLGSATTGALPENFGAVFKSEDLHQSVWNRV